MLAAAGISIPEEDEDEVERFREFLDTISADDFAGSEGDEPRPSELTGTSRADRACERLDLKSTVTFSARHGEPH